MTHDYRRVTIHPGQTNIPHQNEISESDWYKLYNTYATSTCKTNDRWTWGLYCHIFYSTSWNMYVSGLGSESRRRFVIADENSDDNSRNFIIMHEFGHTEHMRDSSGYKKDVYSSYGFTYMDWTTPHYASST